MSGSHLNVAIVTTGEAETIGYLYFQTDTHVVLINNFSKDHINLGPIESLTNAWIEPEVSISIIPMSEVSDIVEIDAN